jgi:peptidoglycan hydrolase-like protein with peptidoglycan-binding domain
MPILRTGAGVIAGAHEDRVLLLGTPMTTTRMGVSLLILLVLSAATMVNLLYLQPGHRQPGRAPPPQSVAVAPPPATAATAAAVVRELELRGHLPRPRPDVPHLVAAAILAVEHDRGLPLTAEPSERVLQALILGDAGAPAAGPLPPPTATAQAATAAALKALAALGYTDAAAIRRFERDRGLPETGRISAPLLIALKAAQATVR